MNKTYLGDSVYIEWDQRYQQYVLTTENGVRPNTIIYLEPGVARELSVYLLREQTVVVPE
jgi:hypothetical protein